MVLSSFTSRSSHSLVERMKPAEVPLFSSFTFNKIGQDHPSLLSRMNDRENTVLPSPTVEVQEIAKSGPMDSNYSAASLLKRLGMDPEQILQANSISTSKGKPELTLSTNTTTSSDVSQAHISTLYDRVQGSDFVGFENMTSPMAEEYAQQEGCEVLSVPTNTNILQSVGIKTSPEADSLTLRPITNQIQKELLDLDSPTSSLAVLDEIANAIQGSAVLTASTIQSSSNDLCLSIANLDRPLPLVDEPFLDAQRVTESWGEVYKARYEGRVNESSTGKACGTSGQCEQRANNPETVDNRGSSPAIIPDKSQVKVSPVTSREIKSAMLGTIGVVSASPNTDQAGSNSATRLALSDHPANAPNTSISYLRTTDGTIFLNSGAYQPATTANGTQPILRLNTDDNIFLERRRHWQSKQLADTTSISVHTPVSASPLILKDSKTSSSKNVLEPTNTQIKSDKPTTVQLLADVVDTGLHDCRSPPSPRKSAIGEGKSIFVPAGTPGGKFYTSTTILPMNRLVKSDAKALPISRGQLDGDDSSHEGKVITATAEIKSIKVEPEKESEGVLSVISSHDDKNISKRKRSSSPIMKIEAKDKDLRMHLSCDGDDPPRKKLKDIESQKTSLLVKSEMMEVDSISKASLFAVQGEESAARSIPRSSRLDHMKIDTGICSAIGSERTGPPISVAQPLEYLPTPPMSAKHGRDLVTNSAESSFRDQRDLPEFLPTIIHQKGESGNLVSAKPLFTNAESNMRFIRPFESPPTRQRSRGRVPIKERSRSPIRHKCSFPDQQPKAFVPENLHFSKNSPMSFDNRIDVPRQNYLSDSSRRYGARQLSPISPRLDLQEFDAQYAYLSRSPPLDSRAQYYATRGNVDLRGSPKTLPSRPFPQSPLIHDQYFAQPGEPGIVDFKGSLKTLPSNPSLNTERANVGHFAQDIETDKKRIAGFAGSQQLSFEPHSKFSRLPSQSYLEGKTMVSPTLQSRPIVHLRRDRRQNYPVYDRQSIGNQSDTRKEVAIVGHQPQQRWGRETITQEQQPKSRSPPALIERLHDSQLMNRNNQVFRNHNLQRDNNRHMHVSSTVEQGIDNVRDVSVNANQSFLAPNISMTKIPLSKRINVSSDAGRVHSNSNRDSTRGRGANRFRGQRPLPSSVSQSISERLIPSARSLEDRIS